MLAVQRRPLRIAPSGAPLSPPVPGGGLAVLGWIAGGLILACWLLFVGRQVASYRHSTGNRRQQLKWLIGGAGCCVLATAVTIFAGNYSSAAAQAVQDAADLGAAALPVGIGVGIVKYRFKWTAYVAGQCSQKDCKTCSTWCRFFSAPKNSFSPFSRF